MASLPEAAPEARSPRPAPVLNPEESVLTRDELCGREWHVGDPHSMYRFIRVLGTGHYGVTYLCSSLATGQHVAVKALDKLHPEYERAAAVAEIRILAMVSDHPNVVDMHEVWEDASYLFIVMEACMGGELFDALIERKHFTEADAASITAAVLSVMQHCHSKGIIHRDLKPENFLLLRPGELSADNLRAIDFGLSTFVERDAICRTCVGSSYYVAPEVLRGAYSYEADAWSVGTITYILLSGFPPFWGSSDQVIFHRILNKPVDFDYQPWHLISPAAKDFVRRLLAKDPGERMTVAEGLIHPWITEQAADVPLSTDIISRLQSFTHQNRVKCLLMTVAAHHLSDEEIGGLRKIFHFIDADSDGEISLHDLTVALQHTGLDMEQQGIMALLAGLDLAHAGTVQVEEFIAAALDQRKVLSAKNVKAIFAELDTDRDGLITVQELQDALQECNISIKAETLGRLMEREGALDSKGMVSAKSFSQLLMAGEGAAPLELEAWMADVRQFSCANAFKQLAMLVVARHMEAGEVEGLRALFQALDEEAAGTISMAQLQDAMRHMGKQVGEQELRQLLEALDLKHHGVIEYDEFLAACLEEQHLTETRLRAAFDFFDHEGRGFITEADVVQVLHDLGMDATHADELLAAAAAGATSPRSAALSHGASPGPASPSAAANGGAAPRTIPYRDFRRLMLGPSPPAIITKALSRASSLSASPRTSLAPLAADGTGPPAQPSSGTGTGGRSGLLETALASIARSSKPPPPPAASPPRLSHLYLPPGDTDFMPTDSDAEESPRVSSGGGGNSRRMGPEPPSPISLMPRYEPPSPINLRPAASPPSPFDPRPPAHPATRGMGPEPPAPISLLPRSAEPLSAGSALSPGTRGQGSPHYRPYAVYTRSAGSPMISLAVPRRDPLSPTASGGLGPGDGSSGLTSPPSRGGAGTGGLTLQQILQQYSSSGFKTRGASSRRGSIDAPGAGRSSWDAGGRSQGNSVTRDSTLSDADEAWLGSN